MHFKKLSVVLKFRQWHSILFLFFEVTFRSSNYYYCYYNYRFIINIINIVNNNDLVWQMNTSCPYLCRLHVVSFKKVISGVALMSLKWSSTKNMYFVFYLIRCMLLRSCVYIFRMFLIVILI